MTSRRETALATISASPAENAGGIGGTIEVVPCSDLHYDPANVRRHGDRNIEAIKASLSRFGQQRPILVSRTGVVVAGNGTLTAARALGWESIQVVRTALEGAEATAYAIADNRTAELAEWDSDELTVMLEQLKVDDAALLEACGFSEEELAELSGASQQPIDEDAQSRLDEKSAIVCPECGHEWHE